MDESEVVLLGIPTKDVRVDESCPFTAKLGGIPAWYDNKKAIAQEQLVCPKCQKSLYLVAQVYAPVTTHRTLYVFGCNSSKCGDTPKSWRVFRFQAEENESKASDVETPPAPVTISTGGWGNDSGDEDDADDWGDVPGSTWGSQATSASTNVDLEELLSARDHALQSTRVQQQPTSTPAKPEEQPPQPVHIDGPHFQSIYLSVEDEPVVSGVEKYHHETQLLNAYLEEEEKENASEATRLRQILKSKDESSGSSDSQGEHAESYERTPLREKLFLRFQKRIKRSPNQCLRYNYGGEPLWPSPPPQLEIPKCPCGEPRMFEMQLIPTTNYFLKVENYIEKSIEVANASLDENDQYNSKILEGGMDWQTVVVWSCPPSCSNSFEEFVYVMPPLTD
ncbi:hypothetical protein LEN26_005760 [Aphanomyces euteiches]|nr:hypothetical protein AeMF1_001190 [Aphanomyces euteiches]KAH9137394.1 hypothetical protein LEN26_005760 [Aphanomyces euteiches]KAH9197706.1 hypothetical protein AeNC1_000290 [Aphanomyces euteiches]